METEIPWSALSETYAFLGNSLLRPMSQTSPIGLEPGFWEGFCDFGDAAVADAVGECARAAARVADGVRAEGCDPVERCSVEYTRLFVGPPSPAAPPWETMYRGGGSDVGFGQATFEMRALLREAGLELRGASNQYEDHMGIELLYLSELCARAAWGTDAAAGEPDGAPVPEAGEVAAYLDAHPLSWAGAFHARIAEEAPEGYFAALAQLAHAMLAAHRALLA